ncbi:MAG: hypothetical protein JNM27_17225 [Leptospirales bacterium]|nr:hypothetical protein [Leptospirales bacterium]
MASVISCGKLETPSTSNAQALLVFTSEDVPASRLAVLGIAQRNGRLVQSSSDTGTESHYQAVIGVPENKFFDSMKELSSIGKLKSETTQALPATPSVPKENATPRVPTDPGSVAAKDSPQQMREYLIEIRVTGPAEQDGLRIPAFKDAFLGVASALLSLIYISIWLSPLIVLYIIYRIRKARKARSTVAGNTAGS